MIWKMYCGNLGIPGKKQEEEVSNQKLRGGNMILTSLSGIQSMEYPYPLEKDMDLSIMHEEDNPYAKEGEPALKVMHEGHKIGYIPSLHTLKERVIEAKKRQDINSYEYNMDKYRATQSIRDEIMTDLFRNKSTFVPSKIYSVKTNPENGDVWSIVISLDYM